MKRLYSFSRTTWCTLLLCLASVLLMTASATAQGPVKATKNKTTAAKKNVELKDAAAPEPDPMSVIQTMCDYLNSLKQFSYHAEVSNDQVYAGVKKLQYGLEMDTYVKRPDKLRVNAEGDLVNKEFFFNGNVITLYDLDKKVYAKMDVPTDIESALDKAQKDFGLKVALTDLASPKLWEHISMKAKHALYVGLHKVRGVPCHHVALDGEDVHLQVWIDAGSKPLPLKVVFLQKKLEASPQWSAYLSGWKTSPQLKDSLFSFTAPSGVKLIKFVPKQQAPAAEKSKGGKS